MSDAQNRSQHELIPASRRDDAISLSAPLVQRGLVLAGSLSLGRRPQEPPGFLRCYVGHKDYVNAVAFSPDGRYLASGGLDRTIGVWDVEMAQQPLCLKGHTASVSCLCFSPDGRWMVSGSADKTVKVWDTKDGKQVLDVKGHRHKVLAVSFSPDIRRIISASEDNSIRSWDIKTGREMSGFDLRMAVWAAAFSASGDRVLVRDVDGPTECWSLAGERIGSYDGDDWGDSIAISKDGRYGLISGVSYPVHLLDLENGIELHKYPWQYEWTGNPYFSSLPADSDLFNEFDDIFSQPENLLDDNLVFLDEVSRCTGFEYEGPSVRVWDEENQREIEDEPQEICVGALAFSPDSKRFLIGEGYFMTLWDIQGHDAIQTFWTHDNTRCVAFAPNGRGAVSAGSDDGSLRLWRLPG